MSSSHQATSGSAATSDTAYVPALPDCEIHENELGRPGVPAEFDGKTTSGSWARMCAPCFFNYGEGLGTGRGQRLVVRPTAGGPQLAALPIVGMPLALVPSSLI